MTRVSDEYLERAVADGKLTEHDRDEIRDFQDLLAALGPPSMPTRPRRYTMSEAIAMEKYSHDRDPEFAARLREHIEVTWVKECQ